MCKPFSCILSRNGNILTHSNPQIHSHSAIIKEQNLKEHKIIEHNPWICIECKPNLDQYDTHPNTWKIEVDQTIIPQWYTDDEESFNAKILQAALAWWTSHVKNGDYTILEQDDDNEIVRQFHYRNGKIHHDSEPAMTSFYSTGTPKAHIYCQSGQRHRTHGPAVIRYKTNGQIWQELYYQHGQQHRDDEPADIEYYDDGTLKEISYHFQNQYHRRNGPAIIRFYPDGKIQQEEYIVFNKNHNPNGPSVIYYPPDGTIERTKN